VPRLLGSLLLLRRAFFSAFFFFSHFVFNFLSRFRSGYRFVSRFCRPQRDAVPISDRYPGYHIPPLRG
jgi:hypothetical protein